MRRAGLLALLLLLSRSAYPCTTFCMAREGEVLYGRNYDFEIGQGFVMTNRRGVLKTSRAGTLRWSSKYASVTFNQWGREFPMDGMNEAGLVIALMWLDEAVYPRDARPALGVLDWIQHGLDNHGTVAELLEGIEKTRIAGNTPLHYLVADATGDAATIEYLEGRLVVHRGPTLPAPVLANDTYARSLAHLGRFTGSGGSGSLDRFATAATMLQSGDASVDRAFQILASVAQYGSTRWSVVYDAARKEVSWVSDRNRSRKTIRLAALALDCAYEGKMLDVHSSLSGDVSLLLEPWSAQRNRELVVSSYATTSFTRNTPAKYAEQDAAYAESFACAAAKRRAAGK